MIDMNLSPEWTTTLRRAGHDAVHWSEIGAEDAADTAIALWAEHDDRIVLTSDLDFGKILAIGGRTKPSVVQLRCADTRHRTLGGAVLRAVAAEADALRTGAFMTFDGYRARTRQLPFTGN